MCTLERGIEIYMQENPEEWAALKSQSDLGRSTAEAEIETYGWKIAAHLTVRELVYPNGSESWDPIHLLELATYLTGDEESAEDTPTQIRHQWHQRMYSRLREDKRLRLEVHELYAAEIHVQPCIFPNEWELLKAARSIAAALDNVDECFTIIPKKRRISTESVHPYDKDAPDIQQSLH